MRIGAAMLLILCDRLAHSSASSVPIRPRLGYASERTARPRRGCTTWRGRWRRRWLRTGDTSWGLPRRGSWGSSYRGFAATGGSRRYVPRRGRGRCDSRWWDAAAHRRSGFSRAAAHLLIPGGPLGKGSLTCWMLSPGWRTQERRCRARRAPLHRMRRATGGEAYARRALRRWDLG